MKKARILSLVLSIMIALTSTASAAGGGADISTGGSPLTPGGGNIGTGGPDFSVRYPSGLKVSLIYLPSGEYVGTEGIPTTLFKTTPTSVLGNGTPSSSIVTNWKNRSEAGKWGIAPIYFMYRNDKPNIKELGFDYSGNYDAYTGTLSGKVVSRSDLDSVELSTDAGISRDDFWSALYQDYHGDVTNMDDYLRLVPKKPDGTISEKDSAANKAKFMFIVDLMKQKNPQLEAVLSGVTDFDGDYALLLEPITSFRYESTGDYYLTTVAAYQQAFLGYGKYKTTAKLINDTGIKNLNDFMQRFTFSGENAFKLKNLGNVSRMILGRVSAATDREPNGGASTRAELSAELKQEDIVGAARYVLRSRSIAARATYIGPKTGGVGGNKSTLYDHKWGWGTIAAPDYINTEGKMVLISLGAPGIGESAAASVTDPIGKSLGIPGIADTLSSAIDTIKFIPGDSYKSIYGTEARIAEVIHGTLPEYTKGWSRDKFNKLISDSLSYISTPQRHAIYQDAQKINIGTEREILQLVMGLTGAGLLKTASLEDLIKKSAIYKDVDILATGFEFRDGGLTYITSELSPGTNPSIVPDINFLNYNKLLDYKALYGAVSNLDIDVTALDLGKLTLMTKTIMGDIERLLAESQALDKDVTMKDVYSIYNFSPEAIKSMERFANLRIIEKMYNSAQSYGNYIPTSGKFVAGNIDTELIGSVIDFIISKALEHNTTINGITLNAKAKNPDEYIDNRVTKSLMSEYMNRDDVKSLLAVALLEAGVGSKVKIKANSTDPKLVDMQGTIGIALVGVARSYNVDIHFVYNENGEYKHIQTIRGMETAFVGNNTNFVIPPKQDVPGGKLAVTKAFVAPAGQTMDSILTKLAASEANNRDYIESGTRRSIIKRAPFAETNTKVALRNPNIIKQEVLQNSILYSITQQDVDDALATNINPAIYLELTLETNDPNSQVDIIENSDGTVDEVVFKTPVIDTNNRMAFSTIPGATVRNWISSTEKAGSFNSTLTWPQVQAITSTATGDAATRPLVTGTGNIIYVRYVKDPPALIPSAPLAGTLELPENYISKQFDLGDLGGVVKLSFSYDGVSAKGGGETQPVKEDPTRPGHYIPDGGGETQPVKEDPTRPGHYIPDGSPIKSEPLSRTYTDSKYEYRIKNTTTLPEKIIGTLRSLAPILHNKSGNLTSFSAGTIEFNADIDYTVWRGYDKPTLASYRKNDNVRDLSSYLSSGFQPVGSRELNKTYNIELSIAEDSAGDYSTTVTHGDSTTSTQTHTINETTPVIRGGQALISSYIGAANSGTAKPANATSQFSIGGTTFNRATGTYAYQGQTLRFHPYVAMRYQTAAGTEYEVDVLAHHESSMQAQGYVDIGWTGAANGGLSLTSNQWSTHARAVSLAGGVRDVVLPGGAIFKLETPASQRSRVGISTWGTYTEGALIPFLIDGKAMTYDNAIQKDTDLNTQLRNYLESLDIVQYVHSDKSSTDAFSGTLLTGKGGQTVLGSTTSSDPKYYIKRATATASARADDADLDITNTPTKVITLYKVRSDTAGNVVIEKSTNNGASFTAIQTLTKTQTIANLTNAEAVLLDTKTRVVTNFIAAIDRNKGARVAGWYNEAWDGVCVAKVDTIYEVGFKTPSIRTAALDPKLTPAKASTSDLFAKGYSSQFRLDNKNNGNVGTFYSVNIQIPAVQDMYRSKKFIIPNATVQDLIN